MMFEPDGRTYSQTTSVRSTVEAPEAAPGSEPAGAEDPAVTQADAETSTRRARISELGCTRTAGENNRLASQGGEVCQGRRTAGSSCWTASPGWGRPVCSSWLDP
jgi:hypothetical protein